MNGLKKLWTKIVRFAEALKGMDDPKGECRERSKRARRRR
jgi:hypothetical protein